MEFFITPRSPFNFDLIASLYSRFPTQCVDLYSKGIYERALKVKKETVLVKVQSVGSVDRSKLLVKVLPDTGNKKLIEEKVRWMLGADDDLKGFYKIGLKDKRFAQIIKNFYGLRAPKTPTVFEALIIAITEQQIALPVAIAIRKRLVERYGDSIMVDGSRYYSFPSPQSLAETTPEDIKKLKFSAQKASYIVGVSQKVAGGEINLEAMKRWSPERIINTLTKIKGLGPWTVEYMMCRGMGKYEALPANDVGLRSSVTCYLGKKERVSEQEVREFLKTFGRYKGYAAFYYNCIKPNPRFISGEAQSRFDRDRNAA